MVKSKILNNKSNLDMTSLNKTYFKDNKMYDTTYTKYKDDLKTLKQLKPVLKPLMEKSDVLRRVG